MRCGSGPGPRRKPVRCPGLKGDMSLQGGSTGRCQQEKSGRSGAVMETRRVLTNSDE